jgi:hypothetical protein
VIWKPNPLPQEFFAAGSDRMLGEAANVDDLISELLEDFGLSIRVAVRRIFHDNETGVELRSKPELLRSIHQFDCFLDLVHSSLPLFFGSAGEEKPDPCKKAGKQIQMNGGALGDEVVRKWLREIPDRTFLGMMAVKEEGPRESDPLRPKHALPTCKPLRATRGPPASSHTRVCVSFGACGPRLSR